MYLALWLKKFRWFFISLILAIALNNFAFSASAKLFDGAVDKLPVQERVALREGKIVFVGEKGDYVCRILVESSVDNAWKVLTDYNNFRDFLPGVIKSGLIETQGDRKIVEQTNRIKVLIGSTQARLRIAVKEFYPEKIAFNFVEGDVKDLDGSWLLEPVSPYPYAPQTQVLITHKVKVQPGSAPSFGLFYDIYESNLKKTLAAIKKEVETRSSI